jgi:hypothetical protein
MCRYLLQVTAVLASGLRQSISSIETLTVSRLPTWLLMPVYGEGEWKMRKHGKGKRRTWRKLHLAIDTRTHEVIAAEVSMVNVADNKVLPTF